MTRYGPWVDLPTRDVVLENPLLSYRYGEYRVDGSQATYSWSQLTEVADALPDSALSSSGAPDFLPRDWFTWWELQSYAGAAAVGYRSRIGVIEVSPRLWASPADVDWPTPPAGATIEVDLLWADRALDVRWQSVASGSGVLPGGMWSTTSATVIAASQTTPNRALWPRGSALAGATRLGTCPSGAVQETRVPCEISGRAIIAFGPAFITDESALPSTYYNGSIYLNRIFAAAGLLTPRYRFVWPTSGYPRLRQRQSLQLTDGPNLRQRQTGGATGGEPLRQRQRGI